MARYVLFLNLFLVLFSAPLKVFIYIMQPVKKTGSPLRRETSDERRANETWTGSLARRRNLAADASLDSFLSVFLFSLAGNKSDLIVWIWIRRHGSFHHTFGIHPAGMSTCNMFFSTKRERAFIHMVFGVVQAMRVS